MPKERNKKTKKTKVKAVSKKKTVKKVSKSKKVKKPAVKKGRFVKPQGRKIFVEKIEPETILGAALFSQPEITQAEIPQENMTDQLAEVRSRLAAINNSQLTADWQDTAEINDLDQELSSQEDEQAQLAEQIDLLEDDNFAASQGRKTIFMYITIGVLMVVLAFVWFRSTMAGIYSDFKNTNALNGLGINSDELTPIDQALKDMKQELPTIKEVTQTQINSVLNKNTNTNSNINQSELQDKLIEETKKQLQNLPVNNNANSNLNSNANTNTNPFNF